MKVGEDEIQWDFGWEFAAEILKAVQLLGTTDPRSIKRLDGEAFKAYWAGTTLRIDIPQREFIT